MCRVDENVGFLGYEHRGNKKQNCSAFVNEPVPECAESGRCRILLPLRREVRSRRRLKVVRDDESSEDQIARQIERIDMRQVLEDREGAIDGGVAHTCADARPPTAVEIRPFPVEGVLAGISASQDAVDLHLADTAIGDPPKHLFDPTTSDLRFKRVKRSHGA